MSAAAVAFGARATGALTASGAAVATVVGAAAVAAGWAWGALVVLYFVASSALSRAGRAEKARRTRGIVAKDGARDARQVLANGGVFAVCAIAIAAKGGAAGHAVPLAAAGALAASTADTWATEVGTLLGGTPRGLLTLRPVPAGTSGAVSLAGTVAMVGGALFVALAARALSLSHVGGAVAIVASAGCAGAVVDSLLGATVQERRWCDACSCATERGRHDCGAATRHAGGVRGLDNDVVNLAATLAGAVTATLLAFAR